MRIQFNIACFLISIVLIGGRPASATAENIWYVGTGDTKSASWQFVLEFSKLWQIDNPDDEVAFVPHHDKDISRQFAMLKTGHSKMVIAPINSISEDLLASYEINIAAILWRVYLVPMVLLKNSPTVTAEQPDYWFIPEGSSIISGYINQYKRSHPLYPFYDTREVGVVQDFDTSLPETFTNEPPVTNKFRREAKASEDETAEIIFLESTSDTDEINNADQGRRFDSSFLSDIDATFSDDTSDSSQAADRFNIDNLYNLERWSGSKITATIVTENTEKIREFFFRNPDGVLLYEMLGPVHHLQKALSVPLTILNLDSTVINTFTKNLPWVIEMNFTKSSLKTVGFQMAVFVNSNEDIEFRETFIKLIRNPPRSLISKSYIMNNLSTSTTKNLSPFILHPGTLKYFNLD